jgi:drug/metabolite transporter (DMT)-like permease
MSVASSIVSVLLALALAVTGIGKLLRLDPAVQQVEAVGVTGRAITVLGLLGIAAAVALIAGSGSNPIGVAGAIGSTLYFAGAIVAHIRARDPQPQAAIALLLVSGVALVLLILR